MNDPLNPSLLGSRAAFHSRFDTVPVTNGTCEWHKGCPPGGQVVLCMMNNMNHQWAGGTTLIGAPGYQNASEMIWKFFKDQSALMTGAARGSFGTIRGARSPQGAS